MKRSLMSFVGFGRYLSACAMPILLVALAVAPSAALATDIYILKKSSGSSYNWGDAIWSASDAQTSGGSTWTSFSESANNWARIGYAGCTHTINLQNQTVVLGYLYPRDGTLTIQNGTFQFPSTCDTRGVHPYADVAYTSVSFTGGAAGILLDVSPGSSRYYESCTFGTSPKFSIAYNKNGDSVEPHKTGFKDVQAAFNQLRCYVGTESQSAMDGQRHIFGVTNSVLEFASVNMNNGDAYAEWLDMSVKLGANNKDNAKAAFDVSGTLCVKGTSANPSTLAIDATGMGVGVYKVVRAGTVSDSTLGTFKVTTLTLPDGTPVNVNAMVNATDASGTVSGSATVKNYALTYASGVLTLTLSGNKIAYTASGYTGTADGNPHGITVTVTKPTSGYTVRYGNTAGTYDLTTSPTLTTVGSKTVYFRITADDYDTETGSATILIEHAPSPGVITTNAIPSHADWGYEIHGLGTYGAEVAVVFTNTTATMTRTLPTGLSELHYLVVGGGGGGGYCSGNANSSGGGGGAGDFVQATINDASQVSGAQLSVTVGRGGGGTYGYDKNYVWNGNYSWVKGTNGTDSVLSISGLEYRAYGGGGGGSGHNGVGASGGSGGGGSAKSAGGSVVTGGRGNIGGTAYTVAAGAGGGGGGAGGEGTAGTSSTGGSGGDGLPSTITGGESVYYAAGGGAGAAASNGIDYRGKGGKGGGGDGGYYSSFTTRQGTSATFYGSGGGGSCNYGNSSDNYKYRSGNGYQGVVIVRYTEPSLYYFTHENNPSPNPVWGQANHWFADEARGVAKGAYPDSYAADVYFGSSSTWPSQTCVLNSSDGHTGADFHLGRLTMAGGNVIIGEKGVTLYFPPDGAADTPIVLNNGGNLFFSFMFLSGVGVIQCAADATNQFGTAILGADSHIGVTNVLSAGQRATTVISPRKIGSDARIPSVLSFLSTGAADSTTDLVVSNASVHLTSPTVASGGAGKLAMNLVVGPLNARNAAYEVDSTTVMFDVDGTLDIASGSTLDIDASRVSTVFSLTNTYDLIRYGACATAGNLAVNDLILPNGTTVALGTTLQDLATTPSVGVSDGYAYTLQCADNTLTLTFQRQLTLDHVEISFDGTTWAWFDSSVTTNVGYYANTPQYRAIYTGWAAGDGPSVRIDNICTGYKQGDTPGTENGHAAWDGTYDVYVPKNYATVVHGMPTVPAGYSASAFDNLTLGTVTLNPLVFTWNKTEDDVWGAPANWDRNYTTPGCTNVPSSKYDTVSFSNRTAVVTVDGTYTIGRYCDTATSDVTIQGVSPNRVTYLAHETTAAPMPMELLGKLVVRALGDDGYSPFKVTRWICEAYHNNVARPVLVMEGLHEHCAAEGDRAANYGGVRTFVIKDCQINMTYAISRPSDVWNEQKGTYAKVLMDGSVITSSSSSYQEGIGRSAGVVRLTNSTWTAAYFRSQVLDTAPVVDLVNGKFYYSYYANQWLSSLSVSGADSELRTYAPDAPASGQTLTLKGTLNVTFPAGLNGFTNATGAVHAPIKATTVDMGSLSTVNISATGYAVGTYPLVAAYNAMTLPTPTTTSIAVDAGKYGRLVLTDSDKTLALQIGNITAVTIPTMAISHEKTGADLKQTITIDPEGAYTVDYTAGAWTDYGTYTATCTLTDTVAYKWADGTTTPKTLFFVITHPVSDTEPSRYRAVEYVETVVTNGTNKATAVNTGIRPQDNIKADFNVAFTRLQALNSYLLADSPGGDYRQYLLAVPYKSGDRKWGVWQMDSDPGWVYPAVSAVAVDTPYHVVVRCSGTNLSFASNAEGPTTSTIDSYSRKSGDTTTLTMFALTTAGGSPSFVKFNGGSIMTNVLDYTEALAREYVPAYDTVDKKYGLWEKVTGQFISEATGTLPFAGPPRALGGLTFLPSATKPEDGVPVQFPNVAWVTDEYGETVNYRSTNYTLSYSRDGGTTPTDDLMSQGTITVTATGAGNGYTGTVSADYTITAPVTRTITVGAMANGKLPLTFGAGSDMLLFAAKGTSDGEGTLTSWTSFENLGVIPAATTSYDYALPSDWGSTVTHLRFFFAPPDKMMTAQLASVTADQSAGTQYLDTGVRASLRTKTVLDLTAKKDGTKVLANQQIMSSIGGNSKQSCRIFVNGNRKGSYALADANGSVDSEFYGYQIFDFNHAIWTFDGSTYTFSFYRYPTGTYSELSGSATAANGRNMPDHGSMGILAPYGSYNGTLGDINSTQVYFGEPLAQVRNFVPAKGYKYANSTYTEVAGLFDTVEAKFYPSAGTADFTAGTAATLDAANLVHVYVAGQSATVKAVAVPTADPASGSSLTYTGSQQKPTITPASAAAGTYSWGTTDWTTVGNHVFTASLPSGDPTYVWSDGTTAAKVYTYTIIRADAPTITVTGYSGTYDGSAHNAVTVTGTLPDGSTTSYSTDNANWSTTMPTVKNVADSTHVYVKVTNPNYHDATGDVDATVTAKALTAAMVTVADDSWTGTARTPTVTVTDGSKLTVNAD